MLLHISVIHCFVLPFMDIPCFVLSFCQLIFELFPLLAIMDNVAMNNHVQVFVGTYIFIFLGVYL